MGSLEAPHPVLFLVLAALSAIVSLLRAWIQHRTVIQVEEEHTRRVRLAVADVTSGHRAEVVAACAELEAATWVVRSTRGRRSHTGTVRSP